MALDLGELSLTISADDRLTGTLDRARRNVAGLERDFGSAGDAAGKSWGARLASGMGSAALTVSKAAVTVMKGAGIAAAGALGTVMAVAGGTALTKGFDRLQSLDQARASLKGLGHDAASVEAIMSNANAAVKGTAFGMGEASKTAASAVAAGIKPGQDLTRTLKLVGDAATIGGTSMGDMGAIFNKVAASNKIQMGEMNQLMDRGIPIQQMLASHLGVSVEEVQKLASAGKIGFSEFQAAMEKGLGGAAQSSGNTFAGALKNVQAALGRLGAAFLQPAFEQMAPFFQRLIPIIDRLAPLAGRAGAAFGSILAPALDLILRGADYLTGVIERNEGSIMAWATNAGEAISGVARGFSGLWSILAEGDFAGADMTFGLEEDSPVVDILFRIREGFLGLVETVRSLDFSGVSAAFGQLGPAISDAMGSLSTVEVDGSGLQTVLDSLAGGMSWVAENADKIAVAIPVVIGAFVALRGATEAATTANNMFGFNSGWRTAAMFAQASATWADVIAKRANTAATVTDTAAQTPNTLARLRGTAALVAQRVASIAVSVASKAMAAAQWLVNAALSANPIGIVVLALAALVAGLVWAWQNSETFRNVVMAVWNGIKAAAGAVVDWFVNTALPFLQAFWTALVAGFTWLKDLVVGVVTVMVDIVVGYFSFWANLLLTVGRAIWDGLVAGFTWLRDGIVAVVTFLVDSVVRSFTFWRNLLVAIVTTIRDWVVERFTWLRDRVLFVVGAMVDYAVTTFTRWRDNVVGLATNIRDWIMERIDALRTRAETTFQNMVDGIGRIWDGLKAVAAAPIRFVIDTVINDGIIGGWNKLVGQDGLKLPANLQIARISVPAFARGGILPGQASGRGDNMAVIDRYGRPRATIRSGEAIISEPVTRRNRGVIDQLLAGRDVPAFFMGGTMPTTAGRVSAHPLPYYGAQWAGDLARPMGTPVYAWKDGVIASTARLASSYGWHIRANHNPGQSLYAHLSQIAVAAGQMVRAGQLIGRVGSTGNSTGPHLHFEIRGGAAMQAGDTGGGGGIFDMVGQWITDKLSSPVKALIDRVPGAGVFVEAAKGMGTRLMDSAIEKIKSLVPAGIFDGSMSGATASGSWQGNANLLMQAGRALGLSRHAMKIALMTAAQESSMGTNRTAMYSINRDGDVGWFQQRATRGDGSVQQLADPLYSLGVFVHGKRVPAGYHVPGLYNIRGWQGMGLGAAAQRVQVSAYPYAYDKWAGPADGWLNNFGYASGTASARRGFAWTGEKGAELVLNPQLRNYSGGEKVLSAYDTAAMLSGKSKERPIEMHLHETYDPQTAARELARQLRFATS